jgi:hypothetical protein
MTMHKMFSIIREQIDADAARQSVAGLTNGSTVSFGGSVLYPYIRFTAECSVPTLIGRKHISVECLVDGVNGLAATADPVVADERTASDELILQTEISADAAQRSAQRTVTHQLGRKFRTIAAFDVALQPAGKIYKRFWILRVGDSRIMTDSVTGNMHQLSASAA